LCLEARRAKAAGRRDQRPEAGMTRPDGVEGVHPAQADLRSTKFARIPHTPETDVIVSVAWFVPVTVRSPDVPWIIVPGPAAQRFGTAPMGMSIAEIGAKKKSPRGFAAARPAEARLKPAGKLKLSCSLPHRENVETQAPASPPARAQTRTGSREATPDAPETDERMPLVWQVHVTERSSDISRSNVP
jgi:hypothetical protein